MISFLPLVSKLILTFTDDFIGKGKEVSSTKLLGRYTKYRPSFLVKILPLLELTNLHRTFLLAIEQCAL